MSDACELSEEYAVAQVRARFPLAVADHDEQGWHVRAIGANGHLYGLLGRKPTAPEAWADAAKLLQMLA